VISLSVSLTQSARRAFNPAKLSGLNAWYDATRLSSITKDGSNFVSQFSDLSGNGNHLAQSYTGLRPLYSATGLNNKPSIKFDGVDDILKSISNSTITTPPYSLFVVFSPATSGTAEQIIVSWGGNQYTALDIAVTQNIRFGNFAVGFVGAGNNSLVTNSVYYTSATKSSSSLISLWVNGILKGTGTKVATVTADKLTMGNSDSSFPFNGYISEIILYNRELSTAERQKVELYLKKKYSL
jgi:hypothetical protein